MAKSKIATKFESFALVTIGGTAIITAAGCLIYPLLMMDESTNKQPQSIPPHHEYKEGQPSQNPPEAVGSAITYE